MTDEGFDEWQRENRLTLQNQVREAYEIARETQDTLQQGFAAGMSFYERGTRISDLEEQLAWFKALERIYLEREVLEVLTTPSASEFAQPGDAPIPEDKEDALYYRLLPSGYELVVWSLTYSRARLTIGIPGLGWYEDAYDYDQPRQAIEAARVWTGEDDPLVGWTRHLGTGRRRKGGDPTKEIVRW